MWSVLTHGEKVPLYPWLIDRPSSDGVTIKIPYGVEVVTLTSLAPHLFQMGWLKLNLNR